MGLAFNGVSDSQHHFKLVLCYASYVSLYRKSLICWIYSSYTEEWREVKAKLVKSSILTTDYMMFDGDISYLYRKGMVHWICNQYMLVYHFEKNFFKVIELPAISIQRMWESEGCLYYAAARSEGGFSIWKSVDDALYETQFVDENAEANWQCKHVIEFPSLLPRFHVISGHNSREALKDTYIELLGFDEDLQILYLALPQSILSYSFETRKVSTCWELCENKDSSDLSLCVSASFSMQPSGVNLPLGDDFNVSYKKSRESLHVFGLFE
ncbi:hypothetical protein FRX31_015227 [Thalictrum thalictroides]|uniref:F-box protein n=1 Tax=Thalictrum thalictroides TaxID=46969 RepID=A0A7J6WCM4_THATH|nr:hypothetical protein FRX31_015227 [Thalictrum thalictroides]